MISTNTPASGAQPAKFCAECGAALSVEAKYCHKCGNSVGTLAPHEPRQKVGAANALPWAISAIALLVLVAVLASRDSQPNERTPLAVEANQPAAGAQSAGGAGSRPPDLAAMTPSERANRLYVRVMQYAESGKADSVTRFAPMVLAAHQMLQTPSIDERYHYGRVAEVVGAPEIVKAQADTILGLRAGSLLGLVLAARAERLEKNDSAARVFDKRLLQSLERELATQNPDYANHREEIDQAVADARLRKI